MRTAIISIFGLAFLAAGPAQAEMTESDEAGMRAFAACLDGSGNDAEACLEKLGRYAWYPRDDATCEAVAARVHEAISGGAQAEWRDLFYNERCARLGRSHDNEASEAGDKLDPESAFGICVQQKLDSMQCEESLGRHAWHPWYDDMCLSASHVYSGFSEAGWMPNWNGVFHNERCRRLGMPYFEPKS